MFTGCVANIMIAVIPSVYWHEVLQFDSSDNRCNHNEKKTI